MRKVWIALGSNVGDAKTTFGEVEKALLAFMTNIKWSQCYCTAPIDCTGGDYVNAVLCGDTALEAETLMTKLLEIEANLGRVRPSVAPVGATYAARTIDLDILMWTGEPVTSALVTIPHPRMQDRLFVLVPLRDVLPENRLMTGENVDERIALLRHMDPAQMVEKLANFMA